MTNLLSIWSFHLQDYLTMFYDGWRDLMDNKSDPRTRDYPLMSSPFPTIAISLTYAYIVKVSGPGLGNHRSIIIGVGIELKMDRTEQNTTEHHSDGGNLR